MFNRKTTPTKNHIGNFEALDLLSTCETMTQKEIKQINNFLKELALDNTENLDITGENYSLEVIANKIRITSNL